MNRTQILALLVAGVAWATRIRPVPVERTMDAAERL